MLYNSIGDIAAEEKGNQNTLKTTRDANDEDHSGSHGDGDCFGNKAGTDGQGDEIGYGMLWVQSAKPMCSPISTLHCNNDGATTAVQGSLQSQRMGHRLIEKAGSYCQR